MRHAAFKDYVGPSCSRGAVEPIKPLHSGACAPLMNAIALADDERVKVDRK